MIPKITGRKMVLIQYLPSSVNYFECHNFEDAEALTKVSTDRYGHGIRAYNLHDNLLREIPNIQCNHYYVNAINYEESLVTPTGYNWEEEEMRGETTCTEIYFGNLDKYQKRGNGSWECFYMGETNFEPQHSEDDDQSETDEE
ncbi:hypothetical protein RHMOL_Rhmol02G0308800 [Rhododendron molle]|uniref:Uncharacterized protein n=1 Tax=Rhododendron molle TaxID=49168 RepID=A0ACC0PYV7_RHOML|nr:hypothetical protein RHMOL_Rhmol02G0308800 [Rhododendron molle]